MLSRLVVFDSATPWTVACQTPLSRKFFRHEILEWVAISSSRESSPPPGIELTSLEFPVLAGKLFTTAPPPGKAFTNLQILRDFILINGKTNKI